MVPEYVVPSTLPDTRRQKLISTFGSAEKLDVAINDYCKAPRYIFSINLSL
jgi:hypothetical protein